MRGIIYKGAHQLAVEEVAQPILKEDQALIKVAFAGICGGDLGIYGGTHPRAKAPLVMGHEFSGVLQNDTKKYKKGTKVTVNPIISCGNCRMCDTGDRHVCNTLRLLGIDYDGGMSEYVAVDEDKIIPVPDSVSLEAAAIIEPVAVAVHTLRETGYKPGDNAIVYGGGMIGICTVLVLKEFGCSNVVLIEPDEKRIALAKEIGIDVRSAISLDLDALKEEKTEGYGFDWVYDCAGAQPVANKLIEAARVKGRIIVVAGYKKPLEFPLNQGMFKEVGMEFVRVYRDDDFKIAANLVANQDIFQKTITHKLSVEEAQKGFDLVLTPGTGAIKVLFSFD